MAGQHFFGLAVMGSGLSGMGLLVFFMFWLPSILYMLTKGQVCSVFLGVKAWEPCSTALLVPALPFLFSPPVI